jgi:SAM domain (Sterile alpha motif)
VGTAKAVRAVRAREKTSMTRAAAWLEELGVGQYAQVLAEQSIDFGVISDLTEVGLEKLGIPLGHRKRMLKAIGALAGANRAADTDQASAISSVRTRGAAPVPPFSDRPRDRSHKIEPAALADSLDMLSSAMFLVDATGRIIHANLGGQMMVSDGNVARAMMNCV